MFAQTREFFRVLGEFTKALPTTRFRMAEDHEKKSLGTMFEETVARSPDNLMLLFEGRQWTYREFDRDVNRLANYLRDSGVQRNQTVALLMTNRPEFIMCLLALAKLGTKTSLINNSLSGAALEHCIRETGAVRCIVGEECTDTLTGSLDALSLNREEDFFWLQDRGDMSAPDWARNATSGMESASDQKISTTAEIEAGETALYVFTSGTTGLPKAAVVSHRRIMASGMGVGRIGFRTRPSDRLYLCLPLYHMTGLGVGLMSFLAAGGSIFLRRGFSASNFWKEVQANQCNCFVYVGELCRFLASRPVCPEERNNPLEKMTGNGLRPDVWDDFRHRFAVGRICEIYGASESNVTFVNFLNKDKTIGASVSKIALVRYDTRLDEIMRDDKGFCIEATPGEPGLLLGEITDEARFDGYTNTKASESKVVRQVRKADDQWFNTGDLVREVDVGFALGLRHFQFVDRTGDTFRWRAENVSTNEVAEVLNRHSQITMANVFGVQVPGTEGKAGMVAFELPSQDEFRIDEFQALVERELPVYAQPVFVRLLASAETSAMFKLLKGDLREQGYDPARVNGDRVYVRKPDSQGYELLDQDFYEIISQGRGGF